MQPKMVKTKINQGTNLDIGQYDVRALVPHSLDHMLWLERCRQDCGEQPALRINNAAQKEYVIACS